MTPPIQDAFPPPIQPSRLRCVSCGYDLTGAIVGSACPECGRAVEESIFLAQQPGRTSGYAIASMVIGIISLGCFVGGPVALLMWELARREMKAGKFSSGSRGMAIAGLVLGSITTAILVIYITVMFIEGYWGW